MPKRPRKLQRALDTIELFGGIQGAAETAEDHGVEVSNIKYQKAPVWKYVSNGRIPVYLKWDSIENAKARKGESDG